MSAQPSTVSTQTSAKLHCIHCRLIEYENAYYGWPESGGRVEIEEQERLRNLCTMLAQEYAVPLKLVMRSKLINLRASDLALHVAMNSLVVDHSHIVNRIVANRRRKGEKRPTRKIRRIA